MLLGKQSIRHLSSLLKLWELELILAVSILKSVFSHVLNLNQVQNSLDSSANFIEILISSLSQLIDLTVNKTDQATELMEFKFS